MRITRLLAGGGVTLASVGLTGMLMVGPAGAVTSHTCSTATTNPSGTYTCTTPPTSTEPSNTPPTTAPTTPGSQGLPFTATDGAVTNGSSLPFTGADFAEIGAVGMGALALGGILTRRNRRRKASA